MHSIPVNEYIPNLLLYIQIVHDFTHDSASNVSSWLKGIYVETKVIPFSSLDMLLLHIAAAQSCMVFLHVQEPSPRPVLSATRQVISQFSSRWSSILLFNDSLIRKNNYYKIVTDLLP